MTDNYDFLSLIDLSGDEEEPAVRPRITDTTLRDAHQSLWATRMRTEDMIPVLEQLDQVGYYSLEMWGGATFEVCIRFLNEDPWERIRVVKKHVKNTPLQMLLRGQNVVGFTNYPDDVVDAFVDHAAECGMDIFRIFDALNDVRNLTEPMKAVKKTGKHVQSCICYTLSPVHTNQLYLDMALRLQDMGADSICIKDMAGMITPYAAFALVSLLKEKLDVPVQLHTHYVGGMAIGACLKAVEAGLDVFDTASGPLAFGSSQPPVETLVRALQGTPWDTGLNLHRLFEISSYWEELRVKRGYERGVTRINDMKVFEHQVPGGMISNLVRQLEEQKALHRLNEVQAEIPRVRQEFGYPPLVTPTSQLVGTQAVWNVLTGVRYKIVPNEVKEYVRGYYGQPPAPINKEIKQLIIGDEEPITCRPADLLENKFEKTKEEIKDLVQSEEDCITYAMFPAVARKFFEYRAKVAGGEITPAAEGDAATATPPAAETSMARDNMVTEKMNIADIKDFINFIKSTDVTEVQFENQSVKLNIRRGPVQEAPAVYGSAVQNHPEPAVSTGSEHTMPVPEAEPIAMGNQANLIEVVAPMVGTFYRAASPDAPAFVDVGSNVKKGETLCIIEAMKLMNVIESECNGQVVEILVDDAQPVEYGQVLFLLAPVD